MFFALRNVPAQRSEVVAMAEEWRVAAEQLSGRLNTLDATFEAHAKQETDRWEDQKETNSKVEKKLDRPSRFDSVMQSVLLAVVVGLVTFLVTH